MANIDNAYTVPKLSINDNVLVVDGNFDPTTGAGYEAPVGSLFLRSDTGALYQKTGPADTDWALNSVGSAVPRFQLVYVGKHGTSTPPSNGRTPEAPFLTFTQAITYINTQTPSNSNRFQIVCDDAGEYNESFTIPSHVLLYAPAARITGNIIVSDFSELHVFSVEAATGSAVSKIAGSDVSRIDADTIRSTGNANTIHNTNGSSGVIICKARQVYTENGAAVLDESDASGHIHIDIEDLYITGTGNGIDRNSGTGLVVGRVAHILEIGGGVGNGTAIEIDAGRVDLIAGYISTATAYNVSGSGTLKLVAVELTGARIQTSGNAVVDVLEADVLRWVPVNSAASPYTPRRIGFLNVDTSAGPVTINLPFPPSSGDNISFQDARNTFETNNLIVNGNGKQIDTVSGGVSSVTLDVSGTSGIFIFNASIDRWSFSRIQEEVAFSPENLIYVTKNGSDIIGDGSFSNPFFTVKRGIQEALARVAISPVPTSVKVLDGVYDEINPLDITGTNCEYVQIQGEHEFAIIIRPSVATQPLFTMTSNVAEDGPSLNRFTIDASSLPGFKINNQAGVSVSGLGRFVVDKVNIHKCGIGYDTGNGSSAQQEAVFDFASINDCNIGVNAKGDGVTACQVVFLRDNDVGLRGSGNVRVEIGNYATQGSDVNNPTQGVGFELNDNVKVLATSGTISNHTTGIIANDNSVGTFLTTIFDNNDVEFNQADSTATLTIQGALSKTKQLISDGMSISLNYVDTDTRDFIVGNADAAGDTGKEFRVRDFDGRVAIGDSATNANIASGGVGNSRTFNLIDTNGNLRIWRFVNDGGQDPAIEWIKGTNPANTDDLGDAPITSIDAATDTITIDVSSADYDDGLDGGIDRTSLASRAFPSGRVFRVNGTGSNDGNYTVLSSTYNAGPQTISITVTTNITVSEGAGGTVVFGGGAGRTNGVSTFVGNPAGAVSAGVGNVWWDMFLQEADYFTIRRRTGGGGGSSNEKVRVYPDHSEWLGSTTYSDSDNATILYLQTVTNAGNYLQINNAIAGNGPELVAVGASTNINVEMIPKGTGTVVVPVGYDANITANSLITQSYFATNAVIKKKHLHRHNGATTQNFTNTPINVLFNTSVRNDSAYTYNAGVITINEAGWYDIVFDVSVTITNNNESNSQAQFLLNGTPIAGTLSYMHHRTAAQGRGTASATAKINLAVNDTISVQAVRTSGTGTMVTLANACRLNIQQIDGP
jgi:hypothetical protein